MLRKIYLFAFIAISVVGLSSCDKDDTIVEPAGLAEYRISNQSSKTLTLNSDPVITIEPNETKKIAEDGGIGIVAPLPSEGLVSFRLYRTENGNEILAIERDPVLDNEWNEEKQDDEEYGLVYYTMTITDGMID